MPNFLTSPALVETATKCLATACSPKASISHLRQVLAFVIVSMVVNVLEETINSVVSGSILFKTSAQAVPSIFEIKKQLISLAQYLRKASQAITGPKSDPPIPILTILVSFLPVCPLNCPRRTASENLRIFAKTSLICGITSLPST